MSFAELFGNISVLSIILFVAGIALVVAELYQPGFGIFGGLGVISLIVGVCLTAKTVLQGIILSAILLVILIILLVIFLALLSRSRLPKKMILQDENSTEAGFSGMVDRSYLLGKHGTVLSICRPAGNADFSGEKIDVISRGEFIERGKTVEVIEIEGSRIVVKKIL